MYFVRYLLVTICLAGMQALPAQAAQKPLVILIPGAGGAVPNDFLVRNKSGFQRAGFAVKITTSPRDAAKTIRQQSARRKVYLVGMSKGAMMSARILSRGVRPAAAVFVSGNYQRVMATMGSAAQLPSTLVVHHRQDRCRMSAPGHVSAFVNWSRGRVRVAWMSMSGGGNDNPCGPNGAHGFFRKDQKPIAAITRFLRTH